ncbi:MAG: DUF1028 domain-containing protein [Ignavibacteriales bacterium]|nr:DUF1028 domain-containing protein [Ignavibacteriales bacterium]
MVTSRNFFALAVVFLFFLLVVQPPQTFVTHPLVSTFSIVAVDPENGDVGVAVQSKFPNVRPVVPWAESGVGAVATQSFANVSFGPRGLTLMRNGAPAEEALRILIANDSLRQTRQVGLVDAKGNAASWTGNECFDWAGGAAGESRGGKGMMVTGKGFAAQGNILVGKETVEAQAATFQSVKGSLADRLVAALVAGGKAGGDRRGEQSAALLVKRKNAGYDGTTDDYIDISIYDHPKPLQELERLYKLHKLYFFRTEPGNLIVIDASLCKEMQAILKDRAYKGMEFYAGPANGIFDAATKKALQDFMGWENYDVRIRDDDKIDREVLEDIRKNYAEWKGRKR